MINHRGTYAAFRAIAFEFGPHMTWEMVLLFGVLAAMAALFFTEKLPVELTAFVGLVFLTLSGYVTPEEAFTGFASPAVITMLSIFFVSAAMLHTGVADMIAGRVHKVIGDREVLLVIAIMLVAGALSAFMNNIAAVAVLLPAVSSICKKTGIAPSRLFMPLSFGAILGGTTTLVGTPPNILAGDLLRERGLETFSLFDFAPVGLILLACGILYMITVGRALLPKRDPASSAGSTDNLAKIYNLHESLFSIRLPESSSLDGLTLGESRFGSALNVTVVGIIRNGKKQLAPGADTLLRSGDVLLVEGPFGKVKEISRIQGVELGDPIPDGVEEALSAVCPVSARVRPGAGIIGKTLREVSFRERLGAVVVGIRRGGTLLDANLAEVALTEGDELLAMGTRQQLDAMPSTGDLDVRMLDTPEIQDLRSRLFVLRIHAGSPLVGSTILDSRIGELVGLTVAGILRDHEALMAVRPKERIRPGDQLLVAGEASVIRRLVDFGDVQLEQSVTDSGIESDDIGVVEVTPAPRSRMTGLTLSEMKFREKTGLQVLSVWSKGAAVSTEIARHRLAEGDALLVQGSWAQIRLLGTNPDFVVLTPSAQEPRRIRKAPVAVGALFVMIAMVVSGFMPIHVAAFTAATLVALMGAITMEEAYRAVEWRAVFLVAAILPVGIAIERTGAAALASQGVIGLEGTFGATGVLAGLVALASTLSQCLDGAPAVVLMAPIVIPAAEHMGMSIQSVMMAVALAASAAFMTPFSHKANLIVMGAGGYKVVDYLKVGTPLTIVLLAIMVLVVPVFFPL